MQRVVSVVTGLAALGLAAPLHAQVFDHLQCLKVKDPVARQAYTADLVSRDPAFAPQPGCVVRMPAKMLCTDVQKTNVTPPPPGAAPGAPAQPYLCYKVKCPKTEAAVAVADQFGVRDVQVKSASILCAPVPLPTTTTTTTSSTTTTLPPAAGAGCPVLNEVMTGTSASGSEEFVELLNPCPYAVDLTGARLVYRSAAGTSDVTLFVWPDGLVMAPGGRLVYGGAAFAGPKDGDLAAGLSGTGGGVGVRDALGALTDSVGYGTATNALVETAAAPAPAAGSSIGRLPDGVDTGNNAADWMTSATITPGAPNLGS